MPENPTSVMPDFKYQWDFIPEVYHNTAVVRTPSGKETRKGYYPTSGFRYFTGNTKFLNAKDQATLKDFMNSVRGRLVPFWFYPTNRENFYNYSLGTLSSVSSITLPFKEVRATDDETPALFVITVGGVSKAFTISAGTGTYGEDVLTFTGGAQSGACLFTFSGRPKYCGRYDLDRISSRFLTNQAKLKSSVEIRVQELSLT